MKTIYKCKVGHETIQKEPEERFNTDMDILENSILYLSVIKKQVS